MVMLALFTLDLYSWNQALLYKPPLYKTRTHIHTHVYTWHSPFAPWPSYITCLHQSLLLPSPLHTHTHCSCRLVQPRSRGHVTRAPEDVRPRQRQVSALKRGALGESLISLAHAFSTRLCSSRASCSCHGRCRAPFLLGPGDRPGRTSGARGRRPAPGLSPPPSTRAVGRRPGVRRCAGVDASVAWSCLRIGRRPDRLIGAAPFPLWANASRHSSGNSKRTCSLPRSPGSVAAHNGVGIVSFQVPWAACEERGRVG